MDETSSDDNKNKIKPTVMKRISDLMIIQTCEYIVYMSTWLFTDFLWLLQQHGWKWWDEMNFTWSLPLFIYYGK